MNRFEKYLVWAWRVAVLLILGAVWQEALNASNSARTAMYLADEAKEAATRAAKEAEKAAAEASDANDWLQNK